MTWDRTGWRTMHVSARNAGVRTTSTQVKPGPGAEVHRLRSQRVFFAGFRASAAVPVSRGSTPGPASDGRHLRGVRYGSSLGKLATAATGQVATFEYSGY